MSAKPNMLHHIAALLHLPTLVDAKAWKRINAAGGYAVDEDDVKTIVIRLRESYDEMRAEAAAEVTALKARLAVVVANVRGEYEHERMQKLGTRAETDDLVTRWLVEAEERVRGDSKEAARSEQTAEASLSECRAQLAKRDEEAKAAEEEIEECRRFVVEGTHPLVAQSLEENFNFHGPVVFLKVAAQTIKAQQEEIDANAASLGESLDLLERNQKWHGKLASSGKPCCCVNCEESRAFLAKHGRKP
jgi:hypothetical protein